MSLAISRAQLADLVCLHIRPAPPPPREPVRSEGRCSGGAYNGGSSSDERLRPEIGLYLGLIQCDQHGAQRGSPATAGAFFVLTVWPPLSAIRRVAIPRSGFRRRPGT